MWGTRAIEERGSSTAGGWRSLGCRQRRVLSLEREVNDQADDPYADRRVGHVERRPVVGLHIDIQKIDDLAKSQPVDQIPDGSSKDTGDADLADPILIGQ